MPRARGVPATGSLRRVKRIASSASVLALAALLTASLSACQAGTGANTSQQYDPTNGRNVNLPADATYGDAYLAVRGAQVVSEDAALGAVVTMVNQTGAPDVLESVTIGGQPATLSGGPVPLAPGQPVSLGTGGHATATVAGLDTAPGDWVELTLVFAQSGTATVNVLTVTPQQLVQ